MKNKIYNLIILDESGSMSHLKMNTISGCNETLNTIRASQECNAITQENYVSIFLFQENERVPSRYIMKNVPIEKVNDITPDEYQPYGSTPLYDALGSTLSDLKATIGDDPISIANVTIITDGYENASHHYSKEKVANMIEQLKERGWSFNFIGANIDVEKSARSLNIDNHLEFEQTEEGQRRMFEREKSSRMAWMQRINDCFIKHASNPEMSEEEYFDSLNFASKNYFETPDKENE